MLLLLMWVWSLWREDAKIKTTKISSGRVNGGSAKFCTSENFPLYGIIAPPPVWAERNFRETVSCGVFNFFGAEVALRVLSFPTTVYFISSFFPQILRQENDRDEPAA